MLVYGFNVTYEIESELVGKAMKLRETEEQETCEEDNENFRDALIALNKTIGKEYASKGRSLFACRMSPCSCSACSSVCHGLHAAKASWHWRSSSRKGTIAIPYSIWD